MILLRDSLLTAACVVATSLSLFAQSAPAEPSTPRPSTPSPSREQMQVRLAEVIAMLQEDDLTPEQRERALAKLTDIRDRLSAESVAPRAARARGVSPDGPRRARFPASPAPEPTVVDVRPIEPADEPMPAMPAEAPEPPMPPEPAAAPDEPAPPILLRSLFGRAEDEAGEQAGLAKVRAGRAKIELDRVLGKKMARAAEQNAARTKHDLEVVELDGQHRALVLRQGKLAEAKVEFERAKAEHGRAMAQQDRAIADHERAMVAERRALEEHDRAMEAHNRAMAEHDADVVRGERFDVVVRSKSRAGAADSEGAEDSEDLRAMIEEMREEMREIRALIRSIRTKTEHVEETRRNALAPALPSNRSFGSFSPLKGTSPAASAQGGSGTFAPTAPGAPGVYRVVAPEKTRAVNSSGGASASGQGAAKFPASNNLVAPKAVIEISGQCTRAESLETR